MTAGRSRREADAVPAQPGPGWQERAVRPRHAAVWIRVAGEWRAGRITAWVAEGSAGRSWQCRVEADPDDGRPWPGWFVYDRAAIRPRYGTQPPISGAPYRNNSL